MNFLLSETTKYYTLIILLLVLGCEKMPTSIHDNLKTDIVKNQNENSTQPEHFSIIADESNDKIIRFSVNDNFDFENKNNLQYKWDFDGDGNWDTDWISSKEIYFKFDDYVYYSTKLAIQNEKNNTMLINDLIAVKPACVDIDGNFYKVVKIGNQWWMAENLRVKHFQNGELIPNITYKNEWRNLNTAAYCSYENDTIIGTEYGLLYNWRAAIDKRGIAPESWHIPSDAEVQILEKFLGGRGKAGGKMKEQGNEHWDNPNNATNSSGFTALPGGQRDSNGDFTGMFGFGFLWTTTTSPGSGAWNRYMDHLYVELDRSNCNKRYGFSVRCIMN